MPSLPILVGFVAIFVVGAGVGLFLGGLACAADTKDAEERRARAYAALVEARSFARLWADRRVLTGGEARERRIVARAVLDAYDALAEEEGEERGLEGLADP